KIVSIMLILSIFTLTLAGCSSKGTKSTDTGGNKEFELAQGVTEDTIKIGTLGPTSGPIAMVGIPMLHGMEAYINKVNDEGGINGRKIELIAKDDEFKADIALQKAEELIEEDEVFAIVGQLGTPGALG